MLTDAQRRQFKEQGFFILPDLFTGEEIDAVRPHIDGFADAHEAQLRQLKDGTNNISRANEISFTAHLAEQDPALMNFVTDPRLLRIATDVLGPDVSLYWDQSVYKKPEAARDFPWHQDNGYTPVEPQQYLTCWIALVDVPVENGSIWVLPGSHQDGIVEHRDTPIGKQCYFGDDLGTPVPLRKGGAAIFSSLIFHRSGPNISSEVRKAYIVQYTPADARNGLTGEVLKRPQLTRNGEPIAR